MGRKLSIYLVGVCAALIGGRWVGGRHWEPTSELLGAGGGSHPSRDSDPSCSSSPTGEVSPTDGRVLPTEGHKMRPVTLLVANILEMISQIFDSNEMTDIQIAQFATSIDKALFSHLYLYLNSVFFITFRDNTG